MNWQKNWFGWLSSLKEAPELLVAVLPNRTASKAFSKDVVAAWATSLPPAAFVIFEHSDNIRPHLAAALEAAGLPPSRLLLVGFGTGAEIGLRLALESTTPACAGLLAYGASLDYSPEPASIQRKVKIRLIGHQSREPGNDNPLGATVRSLVAAGIDARAMQLPEPGLTSSAIRLGAAYLAELSASALDAPRDLIG